jgi:hypothetical protein
MIREVVSVETGCKSVSLTADGIQVQNNSGVKRIAWRDVKAAALAGRDRKEMPDRATIAAAMEQWQSVPEAARVSFGWPDQMQAFDLCATHDPLWIVLRDQIICVLLEASGPEREALLTGLRTRLRGRWLGEDFNQEQLEKRFCRWGFKRTFRTVRTLVLLLSAVMLMVMVWTLVVYVLPIATAELFTTFFAALFTGEWKLASIVGILAAAGALLTWCVKKVISRSRYRGLWTRP